MPAQIPLRGSDAGPVRVAMAWDSARLAAAPRTITSGCTNGSLGHERRTAATTSSTISGQLVKTRNSRPAAGAGAVGSGIVVMMRSPYATAPTLPGRPRRTVTTYPATPGPVAHRARRIGVRDETVAPTL